MYSIFVEKLESLFNLTVDLITEKPLPNSYFLASIKRNKVLEKPV